MGDSFREKEVDLNKKEQQYIGIKEEEMYFVKQSNNIEWLREINREGSFIPVEEYQKRFIYENAYWK